MKIKQLLIPAFIVLLVSSVNAQQNPIRFGISIDSVHCKYISVTDSTTVDGFKRIEFGDGSYKNNDLDVKKDFYYINFFKNPSRHRYIKNGTYTLTYTLKHFDSSIMNYRFDTLQKNVTIQCDSCSLKTDFSLSVRTDNTNLYRLNSEHMGSPYTNSWKLGDGDSSMLDSFKHLYTSPGQRRITLKTSIYDSSLQRYCTDSVRLTITIFGTNIVENKTSDAYKVYPNPFKNVLDLENPTDKSEAIKIYDINGKLMQDIWLEAGSKLKVDVNNWSTGMYTLQFQDGSSIKILKE